MNLEKLKQAEEQFFAKYPGGFDNPEMIQIRKKHSLQKMFELTQDAFAKQNFKRPDLIVENMVKVITRSSLIAVYEKTKFRNFALLLLPEEKQKLSIGLRDLLHGNEQIGFEILLESLQGGRLAKWSLMTILPAYYHPQTAVFIKPTTVKGIIQYFELNSLHYHPTPTWAFYEEFRAALDDMKAKVDPSLSPYYIAFTGFLMRTMHKGLL
jgi:hypothetical protein